MAGEEFYKPNLGLLDIPRLTGFNPRCRAVLVRYQERQYPPTQLLENGWIELYQCYQGCLASHDIAGFVLANGSMSSGQSGKGDIRRAFIEADLVNEQWNSAT